MRTTPFAIPVIDLAATASLGSRERLSVAREVHRASLETGIFFVKNHAVPDPLIAAHFAAARSFFALDLQEKREIDVSRSNCFRGYEAFGTQTIDAATPGDLKEGFIMGPDLPLDHPHVLARYSQYGIECVAAPAGWFPASYGGVSCGDEYARPSTRRTARAIA